MKSTERLIALLIDEGYLAPGEYRIERTYAGYWQRKEGAWSWYVVRVSDGGEAWCGSQWNVREVLAMTPEQRVDRIA